MWATRAALLVSLLVVGAQASAAASRAELEGRLEQVERKLDTRALVDLMEEMKTMQRALQELRGTLELQAHNLESLEKRQRDLYVDIDRRLHRLESGDANSSTGAVDPSLSQNLPTGAETAPVMADSASAPPVLNPADERKDYDAALEVLKQGRYNEAASAFQEFLNKYPGSSYADNAQYWLGEVYYVTRQFSQALSEFGKVPVNYPDSSKIGDARLKIGYIQYEMENWNEARQSLTQVVEKSPGTTTARLAQERLERMQREGH
ncbi:MAG: tol-pal system protein YbgF [Thiogranum sp.]|nr:tol-pal system protein YbgF [Thiogranum sp.]